MSNDNQQPKIDYKLTETLGLASTIFRASPPTDMCVKMQLHEELLRHDILSPDEIRKMTDRMKDIDLRRKKLTLEIGQPDPQARYYRSKVFCSSRQARKVPANWQHPKNPDGSYIPLFEGWRWNLDYPRWLNERERYKAQWMMEDKEQGQSLPGWMTCFIDEYGPEPKSCDYMPAWTSDEKTHWMMYETISEGTPISPAFATDVELAVWLFENKASTFANQTQTYEGWLEIIRGEART
jgi:hypothetical protein